MPVLQTASDRIRDDSSALESTVDRLHGEVRELQRTLHARSAELAGADAHIARLEEKILKLKEAQRELKRLKKEQHALRKSPERKIGQILLAPFRFLQRRLLPRRASAKGETTDYQLWLDRHRPTTDELEEMRREARAFSLQPVISIITPVFDTPVDWLRQAVDSVLAQAYENWELLLIDDASTERSTIDLLMELEQRDPRIRVIRREENGGISAASNDGLAQARGEWIGLLDHDDLLEPDALFQTAKLLQTSDDVDLVYSDEDKLTEDGFASPMLKPDWSPDFFLSYNYVCHFTTFRRALAERIGGFRSEFDGSQDYDLFLRMIEKTDRIRHVPRALYHWRRTDKSVADNIRRKPGALEAGRRAIEEHLQRKGERAHVAVDWRTHAYWVRRDLEVPQKISIVTSARDSILPEKTNYPNFEMVIVDLAEQLNHPAAYNAAVKQTDSPWIVFLDDKVESIESDWLTLMAEHVQRPEVGAVGARLISPDDTIEHAGVVVGVDGIAQPAFRGFKAEDPGVGRQLQITRNYSAVSAMCLLARREVFQEVGGFDEELPIELGGVDLCLKMRRAGYLIIYTPFAKLRLRGGPGHKIDHRAVEIMGERWGDFLARDPYYNPNLSRTQADFSLGN
jgi:glycosyltransferase involved in cell wall biosynthesis